MKYIFILFSLFITSTAFALECPKEDQSTPLCPTSGATLLDDTYPVQAFVISNSGFTTNKSEADAVPVSFMNNIIESYSENNYDNLPQMIFSATTPADYERLKKSLEDKLKEKNIPEETRAKIIGQVSYRQAMSYTWQQDYFESFFNPATGKPVLRKVSDYDSKMNINTGKINDLAAAGKSCGISSGEDLKSDPKSADINGEMGGNIEGAPGGFCMVGDNQGADFTKSFCKSDDNIIQINTSWLTVGHVDEIFKIIPTNIDDGRPKECQFSLMAASPAKGLELLKSPQYGRENVFGSDNILPENADKYFNKKPTDGTAVTFCAVLKNISSKKSVAPPAATPGNRSVLDETLGLFISETLAGAKPTQDSSETCKDRIKKTSNYDFGAELSENKDFMALNTAIQNSIDSDKAKIKEKILSRLPQCKAFFDKSVLEVPNIFMTNGGNPTELDSAGKPVLRKGLGIVNSVYPNPSNSVVMNKTILFPDPENKAYSSYLNEEMKKKGMKFKALTSWDYAHTGNGNIHCASHSLNHCRVK